MPKTLIALRVSRDPKIYRDIEISGGASLYKLAEVINNIFGFEFDHAFGFYDNLKNPYKSKVVYELFADMGEPSVEGAKSVKKSKVADAFDTDGKALAFLFDYGDEWLFQVKRIGTREQAAPKSFWKMIKSVGEAPEQYPEPEDDGDDRPFNEKYEMTKIADLTVVKLREKK
jgi:Plasmid pRiA4b ORF-3-like protein